VLSLKNDFQNEFSDLWNEQTKYATAYYKKFTTYWMEIARKQEIPVFICRYEDILKDKKKYLRQVLEYIFGFTFTDEMYITRRIERIIDNQEAGMPYDRILRSSAENRKRFSREQLEYI
jgi:hypothetical protein